MPTFKYVAFYVFVAVHDMHISLHEFVAAVWFVDEIGHSSVWPRRTSRIPPGGSISQLGPISDVNKLVSFETGGCKKINSWPRQPKTSINFSTLAEDLLPEKVPPPPGGGEICTCQFK